MPRPVHFEIHATDLARARAFYGAAFGWTFEDWSAVAGAPYLGVVTGEEGQPGINGALMPRDGAEPAPGQAVTGAVLTVQVEDYDAAEAAILEAGGTVAVPKHALGGMAWQGYFLDTEGNQFGIHQPDEHAG